MCAKKLIVNVTSDVACPWCWVGKRAIEAAAANLNVDLELRWHPFQLNPDIPHGSKARYLDRLYQLIGSKQTVDGWVTNPDNIPMNKSCAASGLKDIRFVIHPEATSFNTYNAHMLLTYTGAIKGEYRKQNALKEALLRMAHKEGKNMDTIEALTAAAKEAGVVEGEEQVKQILSDASVKKVLDDELREARRLPSFNGVPYFVFPNGTHFSGGQPVSEFEKVLKENM